MAQRFEAVVATLSEIDLEILWEEADSAERRVLIEELVEGATVFPDHLEVRLAGAPSLNVAFDEVGLKSQTDGVGGALPTKHSPALEVRVGGLTRHCYRPRSDTWHPSSVRPIAPQSTSSKAKAFSGAPG